MTFNLFKTKFLKYILRIIFNTVIQYTHTHTHTPETKVSQILTLFIFFFFFFFLVYSVKLPWLTKLSWPFIHYQSFNIFVPFASDNWTFFFLLMLHFILNNHVYVLTYTTFTFCFVFSIYIHFFWCFSASAQQLWCWNFSHDNFLSL